MRKKLTFQFILVITISFGCIAFGYSQKKSNPVIAKLIENANHLFAQKQFDSALLVTTTIIQYSNKNKDTAGLIDGYYRKAYYASANHQPTIALENYREGIALALLYKDTTSAVKMLTNTTMIQTELADYLNAQRSATHGLRIANKEKHAPYIYNLYKNLGNAFAEAGDIKNALEAYDKALGFSNSEEDVLAILNNKALRYRDSKAYDKAIETYQKAIAGYKNSSIKTYARLVDNLGFTLFLKNRSAGLGHMIEALKIRDSVQDFWGLFASHVHLYKYYLKNENPSKTIEHSSKALQVARLTKNPDMEVEALSYYIQLQPNAQNELKRYIFLSDSIATAKKKTQNKYAGILFQTEQKEKENLTLKEEKAQQELLLIKENQKKWILISILSATVFILLILIFAYRKNLHKKRVIESLQKELHHRVKNNLSIVDTFIEVAKEEFEETHFVEKLNELQHRILSIYELHQQLYKNKEVTHVLLHDYIKKMSNDLTTSFTNQKVTIEININQQLKINADKAFSVGLIVNEFITNSLKHAFKSAAASGIITISISKNKKTYHLELSDNGPGLPAYFDINKTETFGLRLINLLTKELNGTIEFKNSNGLFLNMNFYDKLV